LSGITAVVCFSSFRQIDISENLKFSGLAPRHSEAAQGQSLTLRDTKGRPHHEQFHAMQTMHAYEVRPRKDHRGVDLISDALPHLVGCAMVSQTQSTMQSPTQSFAVAHMMP
jgi:hypothetical protein